LASVAAGGTNSFKTSVSQVKNRLGSISGSFLRSSPTRHYRWRCVDDSVFRFLVSSDEFGFMPEIIGLV